MRTALTLLVLSLLVLGGGCTPALTGDTGADAAAAKTEKPTTAADGNTAPKTVSDLTQVKPGESVRVAPANPDDPRFKADPALAGGG